MKYGTVIVLSAAGVAGAFALMGAASGRKTDKPRAASESFQNIAADVEFAEMIFGIPAAAVGAGIGAFTAPSGKRLKHGAIGALIGVGVVALMPIGYDLGVWASSGDVPPLSLP